MKREVNVETLKRLVSRDDHGPLLALTRTQNAKTLVEEHFDSIGTISDLCFPTVQPIFQFCYGLCRALVLGIVLWSCMKCFDRDVYIACSWERCGFAHHLQRHNLGL